ncbi:DUF924 family protein [Paracoccus seriniphilus]|uniref:Uncharacterized conserved protein, DUF924 family n=1 Tax=Paracoccus seriniphilus TaxID=184748 RepID=A0A239PMG4_9RHOB|nr:DUF924 family protein [Paracoccus seriniphilus]SNT68569.1 Uncharacterized conserved protein, DUF924 family [Paracoccus seriniphilus]
MTIKTPQDVSDFWFSPAVQPYWFQVSDEIDRQIIQLFGATYEAAHSGELADWPKDAAGALALSIVLDQFPRNMFRNSSRSFESNDLALAVARRALERGFDQQTDPTARQFFYLPFMHSEDLDDQEHSVALYEALGDANSLHFAREHRNIIARFGRFPHRNAVLGRSNTAEEEEFLKTHSGF